jgi:hypothetical protein
MLQGGRGAGPSPTGAAALSHCSQVGLLWGLLCGLGGGDRG